MRFLPKLLCIVYKAERFMENCISVVMASTVTAKSLILDFFGLVFALLLNLYIITFMESF